MKTLTHLPKTPIHGVHHTARPTWKLRETVEFYRDKLGLPLVHAISARGWPEGHPDFLHFFFDSGNGSTIAFFYYIGTEQPENIKPFRSHFFTANHTAWQVQKLDDLNTWRQRLEAAGVPLRYETRHEIVDSIYFTDPNGYPLEISYQLRPMTAMDADDADQTIRAGMALEDAMAQAGDPGVFSCIDDVWQRKGEALALGGVQTDTHAAIFVLDVEEFRPMVTCARTMPGVTVTGPAHGYLRIASEGALEFNRKQLAFKPAVWYGALTGGMVGRISEFSRDTLRIEKA